jgi:hypothetical protein
MAYPYNHRNRSQGVAQIELHKLGPDVGGGVPYTAALTTTGVLYTANLPYNEWKLGAAFWSTGNDRGLSIKVRPWVDHNQTILGPAYALSVPGATAAATVITLAATGASGTRGMILHVLGGVSGAGASTQQWEKISSIHGVQIAVTAATALTRGTYDWEFVCTPEA